MGKRKGKKVGKRTQERKIDGISRRGGRRGSHRMPLLGQNVKRKEGKNFKSFEVTSYKKATAILELSNSFHLSPT